MIQRIEEALSKINVQGDLIFGTSELVESIKEHTHLSYEKIGLIAEVTEQGVRRWRQNNSGQAIRVKPLIEYAQKIVAAPSDTHQASLSLPAGNAADAIRAVTPLAVQTCVKEGLEGLLGIALNACTIAKLESADGRVRIEFVIE